jgi:imidazole glycerol phosphate synthase glutamine amidotransferase subunit
MIGVVDYGAGNLRSVQNMLDAIGTMTRRVQTREDARGLDGLILPGVGAFGSAMAQLEETGLADVVALWLEMDQPFLGICLGLQLLFQGSDESPEVAGFGRFPGICGRVMGERVPHIGWNTVHYEADDPLYKGIQESSWFYFLHSYQAPEMETDITGRTSYGINFPASVAAGNCRAVQFHPEKSGAVGAKLLNNWVTSCCR